MGRQTVSTDNAPPAIGPYSQAVVSDDLIFTSGQIPLDPGGEIVAGGIGAQTERVFDNLVAVLDAAGAGLEDVLMVNVYLAHLTDFKEFNEIYARRFGAGPFPARATVEVGALPRGSLVEVSAIARKKPVR